MVARAPVIQGNEAANLAGRREGRHSIGREGGGGKQGGQSLFRQGRDVAKGAGKPLRHHRGGNGKAIVTVEIRDLIKASASSQQGFRQGCDGEDIAVCGAATSEKIGAKQACQAVVAAVADEGVLETLEAFGDALPDVQDPEDLNAWLLGAG